MRKFLSRHASFAALAVIVLAVWGGLISEVVRSAELSPWLDIYNADNAIFYAGQLQPQPGCALPNTGCNTPATRPTGGFGAMGMLFSQSGSAAGTTGTGEQFPATASYSLPANTLDLTGRRIRYTTIFKHAANGNACVFTQYFGSESIAGASNTTTGSGARFVTEVVKTGSNTQEVSQSGYQITTNVTPVITAATETDTSAILIRSSVTGATTGADCAIADSFVEYMN